MALKFSLSKCLNNFSFHKRQTANDRLLLKPQLDNVKPNEIILATNQNIGKYHKEPIRARNKKNRKLHKAKSPEMHAVTKMAKIL